MLNLILGIELLIVSAHLVLIIIDGGPIVAILLLAGSADVL